MPPLVKTPGQSTSPWTDRESSYGSATGKKSGNVVDDCPNSLPPPAGLLWKMITSQMFSRDRIAQACPD